MSPLSGRHSAAGRTVCLIMKRKFKTRSRVLRDEELNDVDLDILDKDNNYNKEYTYYLIRGKVLYYLCKFEESKNALNKGLELNKEKENLFKNWIKKVEDELK